MPDMDALRPLDDLEHPPHMRLLLGLAALLFTSAHALRGAVQWETTTSTIEAKAEDERLEFRFPFKITAEPVKFISSQLPCGCGMAGADRTAYQPGDTGVFIVSFDVEDRVGTQEFEVAAITDEGGQRKHQLHLRAIIPEILAFPKRMIVWTAETGPKPQHMAMTVSSGYRVRQVEVTSSSAAVQVQAFPTKDPQVYSLSFTLVDRHSKEPVKVTVTTDLPIPRQATATIWALSRLP
jgi:Protein of unknown function (DUF1573)